jgi:ssDNA-binding Zn-finger/Zn-ribbon topoisomerase 1
MLILLVVVVLLIIYFAIKDSNGNKKSASSSKWISSPPNSSSNSFRKTSTSQNSSHVSTGHFARTTEGFIPEDNCEICGSEWIKYSNRTTGGKFFGCSNYPKCDNTRDKQRTKNFCSHGHKRTTANTAYNSDGSRRCLICRPIAEYTSSTFNSNPRKTVIDGSMYCRNGHKRTSDNTYTRPDGERECRICRRNARR